MQFAIAEHCDELPLLPLMPVRLATLLRYAWWLQDHGIRGGMPSIAGYVTAIIMWNQEYNHPDPRESEAWIWKRFSKNAPKFIRVFNGSQAKLAMRPEYLKVIVENTKFDLTSKDDVAELLSYSILIFTGIRVGHLLPNGFSVKAMKHLLDWLCVKFEPNFTDAEIIVYLLESTKVRSAAKKDPVWTAVGKCTACPMLCPVTLMKIWFTLTHSGRAEDNVQYLMAPSRFERPMSRAVFTRRLRARLVAVAPLLGMDGADFDARKYSGISFRKGAFSALAKEKQPHQLMLDTDHSNIMTTIKYYLSDTIQQRAGNTAVISRGFAEPRPSWAEAVPLESVWATANGACGSSERDLWKEVYGR